jgi:hypothetical protein
MAPVQSGAVDVANGAVARIFRKAVIRRLWSVRKARQWRANPHPNAALRGLKVAVAILALSPTVSRIKKIATVPGGAGTVANARGPE